MQDQPGPVAGWPPLFARLGEELAGAVGGRGALVLEHAHHLAPAPSTLALLGGGLLPALAGDSAGVLLSHAELPDVALPARAVRWGRDDLRVPPAAADRLLRRNAPGLGAEPTRRLVALCGGAVAVLLDTGAAAAFLGAPRVERAIQRAGHLQELLAALARSWLHATGIRGRRALRLALRLGYSHPTLASAVLGEGGPSPGPWLQPLTGGWSRVRTQWRDPLAAALASGPPLEPEVIHRAADHLLDHDAADRAIALYLEVGDPDCAAHALAREADRLVDLGRWDGLAAWLARLPEEPAGRHRREAWTALHQAQRRVAARVMDHLAAAPAGPDAAAAAPGRPAAPTLAVHLLGRLRVRLNGVAVDDWPSGRGRSLLKYLLTHRDPWPQREVLMEVFWPGSPPAAARNSLNVAVHGLRRALRAAADVPVVELRDGAYRLADDVRLWLDVDEFERHLEAGRRLERSGEQAGAIAAYELARSLYDGDLLADAPYEEWSVLPRERLRQAHLDLLDRLSRLHFDQGRYAASAALCRRAVELDPCREDMHQRLIRCYSRQGRPYLALRQYRACAAALRAELDVDPASATVRLQEALRRHEAV